jgi:hypothetical protein
MKVSLHRRRHESLPPKPRRSPRVLIVAAILTTGTMAFAAASFGEGGEAEPQAAFDPAVSAAEQATRDVVDARLRAHLKRLPQG